MPFGKVKPAKKSAGWTGLDRDPVAAVPSTEAPTSNASVSEPLSERAPFVAHQTPNASLTESPSERVTFGADRRAEE
jgi:hypothetical protein